jgi:hypothetical protein
MAVKTRTTTKKTVAKKGAAKRPASQPKKPAAGGARFHIYENEPYDEKRLASWIKQASKIPGWIP